MMETQVTMPLDAYKSLESKAAMLDKVLDGEKYVRASIGWQDDIYFITTSDEVNTVMAKEIDRLQKRVNELCEKVQTLEKRKKSGWPNY